MCSSKIDELLRDFLRISFFFLFLFFSSFSFFFLFFFFFFEQRTRLIAEPCTASCAACCTTICAAGCTASCAGPPRHGALSNELRLKKRESVKRTRGINKAPLLPVFKKHGSAESERPGRPPTPTSCLYNRRSRRKLCLCLRGLAAPEVSSRQLSPAPAKSHWCQRKSVAHKREGALLPWTPGLLPCAASRRSAKPEENPRADPHPPAKTVRREFREIGAKDRDFRQLSAISRNSDKNRRNFHRELCDFNENSATV